MRMCEERCWCFCDELRASPMLPPAADGCCEQTRRSYKRCYLRRRVVLLSATSGASEGFARCYRRRVRALRAVLPPAR